MAQSHWSMGLINTMKNAESYVIKSDKAVVIRDKYPKAKHHFLVLPWSDIEDIYCVSPILHSRPDYTSQCGCQQNCNCNLPN